MKQTSARTVKFVMKEIHERFEFMLRRGYEVVSVEDVPAGWQALLRKPDLDVRIYYARGEDDVSFRTSAQPPDQFFDIGSVVYAATGEKIPLSSYDDISKELQKYIDRIETYFQGEPVKIQESLKVAQEEYRATLVPAGVVPPPAAGKPIAPKESKKIPILYYPLMGIILLLTFFFLATLCGVVVDRLFTVFSP